MTALTACSVSVPTTDLYGDYVATYKNGTERLTLRSDGTYSQEVRLDGSEAVVNAGTWEHDQRDNSVLLRDCIAANDGFATIVPSRLTPVKGICGPGIGRAWVIAGNLELGGDEVSAPFKKVH